MTHTQRYITLIGIILILSGAIYFSFNRWQAERIRATRMENNYHSRLSAASNRVIQEQLTRKQFERFYEAKIDSLKQLGLKRIDGITSVKIKKVFQDRLVWRDSIITIHDTIPVPVRLIAASDSCLNLVVTDMGDSARIEADISIQAEVVYLRGERIHPWWKFWRSGRVPVVHVLSNCGQVHVRSVSVVD
jgi:hypothetical protein